MNNAVFGGRTPAPFFTGPGAGPSVGPGAGPDVGTEAGAALSLSARLVLGVVAVFSLLVELIVVNQYVCNLFFLNKPILSLINIPFA